MSQGLVVEAEPREDFGKNVARRLRRSGRVPCVVYGGGGPSIPITVDPRQISEIIHSRGGHNVLFTLEIKGKAPARVMLREWQLEPVRGDVLHVDMVRVARDTRLKVRVPVQLIGEAKGVKVQGGILEFVLREVEVECLPDDIPERIDVDITELMIGRNLRVSDLAMGEKVKALTDPNHVVVHVVALKAEEVKPAEVTAEVAPAEPEVIKKGKAEAEGEAGAEEEKAEKGEKKEKEGKKGSS
jgi:large subunit ribosomal protein L25